MSLEVSNAVGFLGAFASNKGYTELIKASEQNSVLKKFFNDAHAEGEQIDCIEKELNSLIADNDVEKSAKELAALIHDQELVMIVNGTYDGNDDLVNKSVGGTVIESVKTGKDELWVNTVDASGEKCAVYCNPKGNVISVGDGFWWQAGICYWTPKKDGKLTGDSEIELPKIGFSGVNHPGFKKKSKSYGEDNFSSEDSEDEDNRSEEEDAFKFEMLPGTVVKLDKVHHLVFGWFSIVTVDGKNITDTQGDIISPDTIEFSAYDFVLNARKGGEMHEPGNNGEIKGIGRLVESVVFTIEKQEAMIHSLHDQGIKDAQLDLKCVGWWGGFFVENPDTWKKVESGDLKAFSIGGRGKRAAL